MNNIAVVNTQNPNRASQIENLLKSFWQMDSFQFVGIYQPHENGKSAWFNELRSPNGTLLYFPDNRELNMKGTASAFLFPNMRLKKGEWYKFNAQINPNSNELDRNPIFVPTQNFQPIGNAVAERIKKEKFIKDLFNRNGKTPDDAQNLANSLRNFQIELYTKTERFIFELLQNADDFPLQGKSVEVNFTALNENILIYHNGKAFSEGDVKSICSIGNSSKSKDISATGYKGIGFKSVFTHSKCVYINSGSYSFCFDSDFNAYKSFARLYKNLENDPYYLGKHQDYIGSSNIPWQLKPIWRENYMYPKEVKLQNDFFKSNVGFCLEFGTENILEFNQKVFTLFEEPRFLLFLRNISKINVATNEPRFTTICREVLDNITTLTEGDKSQQYLTYSCNSIDFSDRKESFKNIQNIPPKLLELPYLTISFAALINDGKIEAEQDSILFTYLPTEDRTYNFPFLVNCDFVTSSNREQILPDNKWNEFVFEQIGYQVFNWIKHISETNIKFIDSVFNIIPSKLTKNLEIQHSFNRGFNKAIDEVAFILDYAGQFQTLKNILIDETGLINLLGVELFQHLSKLSESPINNDLENNKKIKSLIQDFQVGKIFGIDDLIRLITNGAINEWLKIPTNNIQFLQKIAKNKVTADKLRTLNIFLNHRGELKTANELYWSVEGDLRYIDWLEPQYLMPEIRQALEASEHLKSCFKTFEFKSYVQTRILPDTLKSVVDGKLNDKETCLKFYRFLFKNRDNIDSLLKVQLKWFRTFGKNEIIGSLQGQNIFFSSTEIDEIAEKGWLPNGSFYILANDFMEVGDDAQKWKKFWQEKFDIKEYECDSFIKNIILNAANKATIVAHIGNKKHNLNFYRYVFAHRNVIDANKKTALKAFPVWSYSESIIDSFNNNNIYLVDSPLLDVYERDIVPKSLYNIVSDDFCESATEAVQWQSFWKNYFDVKQYEAGVFISNIILGNRIVTNYHQKIDRNHSIIFWSYLLDNRKTTFDYNQLSNFHVLVKHTEGEMVHFDMLSNCYLADDYNDKSIEGLVKEFKPDNAVFISPVYGDATTFQIWAKFFIKCQIKHDESGLILTDLLPILSGRKQENSIQDIRLLFKFSTIIDGANKWQSLRNIKINTKNGGYRSIQECFITDSYTGLSVVNDILPSIDLPYQVSDVYMKHESERKEWLIFWKKFAPNTVVLDDQDKVIEQKLKCLVEQQDTEGYRTKHLEHFKDILALYENVKEAEKEDAKIIKLKTKIATWKLIPKGRETVVLPNTLFLPSVYKPTFDYEDLGVTDLITVQFVSENYSAFPNAKEFLRYLGVGDSISANYIQVLIKPKAASRFWELWRDGTFNNYSFIKIVIKSDLICIPCGDFCKAPKDVYSLDIADYVLDKSKLPSVNLRGIDIDGKNVEQFLGFGRMLDFGDCLTFLRKQPQKAQFETVLGWLISYNPTQLALNNNPIIQDFKRNGKWLNVKNEWIDVNNLLFFDDLPFEIRSLFNTNQHRISFPKITAIQDKRKICTWLGVNILTEKDFTIEVKDKTVDSNFIAVLRDRLELICFDVFHKDNWEQKTIEYRQILSEWSFCRCSEITQTYNDVNKCIPLSMSAFKVRLFKEQKELCYVNVWNHRKTFIHLINALNDIFKLKEDLSDFFDDRYDVVDMLIEKGLNVPENWKRPKPVERQPTNTVSSVNNFVPSSNTISNNIVSKVHTSNGEAKSKIQEPEEMKSYNPQIEKILRGLDGLDKNSQFLINRQTSGDALTWLEERGWNINNASAEFGILNNVVKNGHFYSIIVRSAKTGLLRLDQYNWNNLGLENYKLLVQTGGRLNDFILYDTQTELLDAPYNSHSVIVKKNTKQPAVLTTMVDGLQDMDKAHLYFITSEKGVSIFEGLTGLKSQSDQESGVASEELI